MPRKNPNTAKGILARCGAGHETRIFTPAHSLEEAAMLAGLMDGTSKFYVHSPRDPKHPSAVIGRCVWVKPEDPDAQPCRRWFTAELFGF